MQLKVVKSKEMLHDHKETQIAATFLDSVLRLQILGKGGKKPLGGFVELMRLFTSARNSVNYTNILLEIIFQ